MNAINSQEWTIKNPASAASLTFPGFVVVMLVLIALLAGCEQAPGSSPINSPASTATKPSAEANATAATPATPAKGLFVLSSGQGSIAIRDAVTLQTRPILNASGKEFHDSPSFSADGAQIVFVTHILDASVSANQIRAMNSDGTNVRTLFKAPVDNPRIFPAYPHYTPDGTSIYFSLVSNTTNSGDQQYQIARGPAAGGSWTVVVDNGNQPALSSDGKRLAFTRLNNKTLASSLWIADADGQHAQEIFAEDHFQAVIGTRFSPDGQWIAFAASGPPRKKLPGARLAPRPENQPQCALGVWEFCLVQRAYADGLPWDLWLVSVDGKSFKQLTTTGLDSPWPAFSADGRFLAFAALNGFYVYDRAIEQVSKLSDEGGHGVIDWYQK